MEHEAPVGFLEQLPVRAVLDGELVAFGSEGKPDFERVCERMLYRHAEVALISLAFDVRSVEGNDLRAEPRSERRRILEGLGLDGLQWRVPEPFDDGPALWDAVCQHEELEGLLAKRSMSLTWRDFDRARAPLAVDRLSSSRGDGRLKKK